MAMSTHIQLLSRRSCLPLTADNEGKVLACCVVSIVRPLLELVYGDGLRDVKII